MEHRYPDHRSATQQPEEKRRRIDESALHESSEETLVSPHTFSAITPTQSHTEDERRERVRQQLRSVAKDMKKPLVGSSLARAIEHFLQQECTEETIRAYLNAPSQEVNLKQEEEDRTTGPELQAPTPASSSAKWKPGDTYTDPHYPLLEAVVDRVERGEDGGNLLHLSPKGGLKLVYDDQQGKYYEAEDFADGEENTQADMGQWTGKVSTDHYHAGQTTEKTFFIETQEAMKMEGAQTMDPFIADQMRQHVPLDQIKVDQQASGSRRNKQEDDLRRFRALIEGMQKSAVIPPLDVRLKASNAAKDSQKWSLVNGGHRILAASYLGFKKIPAQLAEQ